MNSNELLKICVQKKLRKRKKKVDFLNTNPSIKIWKLTKNLIRTKLHHFQDNLDEYDKQSKCRTVQRNFTFELWKRGYDESHFIWFLDRFYSFQDKTSTPYYLFRITIVDKTKVLLIDQFDNLIGNLILLEDLAGCSNLVMKIYINFPWYKKYGLFGFDLIKNKFFTWIFTGHNKREIHEFCRGISESKFYSAPDELSNSSRTQRELRIDWLARQKLIKRTINSNFNKYFDEYNDPKSEYDHFFR